MSIYFPDRSKTLQYDNFYVSFPQGNVLQITLNRPEKLNCINKATSLEIQKIWDYFDKDESLWVGIITGSGRAFCTGADLREWNEMNKAGVVSSMDAPGLAGIPRRSGRKPIIAAVNGICMGGGFEMIANCDMVLASSTAVFSLPEVKRGIVPVAGCLPRLTRTIGLQRTMDLVLTGRNVTARTLYEWGLVSRVIDSDSDVVKAAVQVAQEMCKNSPDALIIARQGIRMSWEIGSVEEAVSALAAESYPSLVAGPNFAEGIEAFVDKRPPAWINSKL
ncbi:enoyl-CoA hydratase/isomerase family protein [Talaromyces stipitatus ATCC 10500]|uniref:Enoyl-CoA hydratase/isomerase family protein n=1 Tax=Talaromyces stipitatus (strain ATCC 10500 / CBS 375.48 / QM 6759 / NRRL 1006) TaxID=441959 RepID=B8MMM8_TALSN|nr:enoyl-CoA hydratase/isomerase family protein [Talaromyces stipitatus ATCC 10500]EED13782.1 enoyl-CoA hydratase/isomerase family protein [Talaromyces stipitatus ATCC 10500]